MSIVSEREMKLLISLQLAIQDHVRSLKHKDEVDDEILTKLDGNLESERGREIRHRRFIDKCRRSATYWSERRKVYERLVANPWLPMKPDPGDPWFADSRQN